MASAASRVWDFVIVGGGSAGCALANRLSADPSVHVLVLEAGHSDFKLDPFVHMPAALPIPIGNRLYDWKYETEPEPYMNGRRIFHARGKVLGGSSSINGMIFQRGNPLDFERWAAEPGMKDWDYLSCLPYFKRMENCLAGADAWRGGSGPLVLERGPATNPLFGAFFEAVQQAGYPLTDDVNGYRQEGFARFDRNIHRGRRLSAARAYLHPVMKRPNLKVETLATATKVVFEGKQATGVDYVRAGRVKRHARAKDVILCGGAINSPQLLQLSGVGNADELKALGIDAVHNLPGVGENAQDHLEVYIQYVSKLPVSIAPGLRYRSRPKIGFDWLFFRKGLGATNHFEGGGFCRSQRRCRLPQPDVPLPAGGDPLRRLVADRGARLPGARRSDVRRHPRVRQDPVDRPDAASGDPVQLPVDAAPTAGSGSRRSASRGRSSTSRHSSRSTAARSRPGRRSTPTRRSSTGSPATPRPRCTRRARRRWAPTT